jgi:uncharacterized membrane protein (UPF0182 family)
MPPDDDPIIRSLRDAGIRPFPPRRVQPPVDRRRRAIALALVGAFIVFVILLPALVRRLSDWLWYREIGFERVFFTKIVAQWTLGVASALLAFAILYGTARWAIRGLDADNDPFFRPLRGAHPLSAAGRRMLERGVGFAALAGTALVSLFFGLGVAGQWRTALQFVYRTPFGVADPVFGRDVGYYVFSLPAIALTTGILLGLLMIALFAIALPVHIARGALSFSGWRPIIKPVAERQLTLLAAVVLVVIAVRIEFVRLPDLLFGSHLPLAGANYVDLHVRLPALHLLALTALVGAVLVVWGGLRGRLGPMAVRVVAGYAIVGILAALIPSLYQRLIVQPNELARETAQIVHHIAATRQAWGIDSVQLRELGTEAALTPQVIAANRATIDNVRLWDREPLLQTYGQIQSIRTYYDFLAIDDDRYRIRGQLRQVMM